MNKDDFQPGDEQLLQRIHEAETDFSNNLEPDPAVKEKIRGRLFATVPFWKKPVPVWAAAAALLLFLIPAGLLWPKQNNGTTIVIKTVRDTLNLHDTVRLVEYREAANPNPAQTKNTNPVKTNSFPVANVSAKSEPVDMELQASLLGIKTLPETLAVKGFTHADDTVLKKFLVTF